VVQDCFPQGANAEYTVQYSPTGGSLSRAMCIDCENPCAQYNCTGDPQSTVISPCTREPNCPYLKGSLQVFTGYYNDSPGTGYVTVLIAFGVLWGFVLVSVLVYNRLILSNMDWKSWRNIPNLTFRKNTPQAVKSSNFRSILPEPALGTKNRQEIVKTASDTHEGFRDIHIAVSSIFDRLLISAGQNKAAAVTALAVTQRFWYRMLSYNHYLAPYTRASERERLVHGVNVLTRVSWLFFCVALCYRFTYASDDNSCYKHTTAEECSDPISPFNSNEEYCEWVGTVDTGGQEIHQAQCLWNFYTGNVVSIIHIVVVTIIATVIPRFIYTNFLVESVLLAPGGSKNAFAHNPARPLLPSKRIFRKIGVAGDEEGHFHSPMRTVTETAETVDTRFYNLGLADNKGNVSYLETTDATQDASLLYRSFLFEFTKYRNAVLARQDERAAELEAEWAVANPFVWAFKGTLTELSEEIEFKNDFWSRQLPDERAALVQELTQVYETSKAAAPQYKELLQNDADQFSVRLMTTFFTDLLGKDSLQTRLIRQYLSDLLQDRVGFRDVRNWVKFWVVIFMIATCCCLVYGSIAILQGVSQRRQWYWIITVGFAIAVDFVFVETLEALWFNWALPLCVADTLTALQHTVEEVLQHFQRGLIATPFTQSRPTSAAMGQNLADLSKPIGDPFKAFSMPNYQFVSTNLAHRFPRHLASRIVLSYESVYPRTITAQRWPTSATAAQLLCGTQPWSSGLGFESIGYVLFSNSAMWIAVLTPKWFQQIVLTGLLCLVIWLLSWLVFTVERGSFTGIYIASAVAGVLILVLLSYRFSWDHDSEHYGEGMEGLRVSEIARDLISPPPSTAKREQQKHATFARQLEEPIDHFPSAPPSPQDPRTSTPRRNPSPERFRDESPASPSRNSPSRESQSASRPLSGQMKSTVSTQHTQSRPGTGQRPLTAASIVLHFEEEKEEESKREEYYLSSSSSEASYSTAHD